MNEVIAVSTAIQIGTYVLYGKMGVCLVRERITMPGGAGDGTYYVLSPMSDSRSSVYVPCGNAQLVARMRPLLTREEIDSLLAGANEPPLAWVDDRNQRFSLYRSVMGGSDRREWIRLIRCLHQRKKEKAAVGKRLSSMDETALQECIRLLTEELSLVLEIPRSEVEGYVHSRVNK